jgi:hypothetical protein
VHRVLSGFHKPHTTPSAFGIRQREENSEFPHQSMKSLLIKHFDATSCSFVALAFRGGNVLSGEIATGIITNHEVVRQACGRVFSAHASGFSIIDFGYQSTANGLFFLLAFGATPAGALECLVRSRLRQGTRGK